jgi:hypothetical protein
MGPAPANRGAAGSAAGAPPGEAGAGSTAALAWRATCSRAERPPWRAKRRARRYNSGTAMVPPAQTARHGGSKSRRLGRTLRYRGAGPASARPPLQGARCGLEMPPATAGRKAGPALQLRFAGHRPALQGARCGLEMPPATAGRNPEGSGGPCATEAPAPQSGSALQKPEASAPRPPPLGPLLR